MIQKSITPQRERLLLLLALVFLTRVLFATVIWKLNGPAVFFTPDSAEYVEPAESLLHGSYFMQGHPEIFRTPGYSFLLTPAAALHHVVLIGLLENFLLAILSAWLIWKIATTLFEGTRAAFWAVLLYCFEPMSFLQSEKLMSDVAFATLFLLSVWVLLRFLREPTYTKLTVAALALGAATYMRPVAIYFWVFLTPVLLVFPRSLSWQKRVSMAILFPLVFAATLSPWVIRNRKIADYTAFSSTGDANLYFYVAAAVEARVQHKSPGEVNQELGWADSEQYFRVHPEQRTWSQGAIERFHANEARTVILSHPGLYALIHSRGCISTVFNPGVTELLLDLGLYPARGAPLAGKLDQGTLKAAIWLIRGYPMSAAFFPIMAVQLLLYYWLALRGGRNLTLDVRWLFLSIVVYFVLVSGIPGAVSRWRTPMMPIICICAGVALAKAHTGTQKTTASAMSH